MKFSRLLVRLRVLLWETPLGQLPWWKRFLVQFCRVNYALAMDIYDGRINLYAMSLVYTTLLAIVPFLALSFSVAKALGMHERLEPLLYNFLTPLGDQGVEITDNILTFVDNIRVGVLGSLGLLFLIYTVISLVQKVEESFNYIWRTSRLRSIGERFSHYMSAILIGPVLVTCAMGITGSMMSSRLAQKLLAVEPFGTLFYLLSQLTPYILVISAFTAFYMFIPNTRVRLGPALIAGTIAGFVWQSTSKLFAVFVVGSTTKYTAIYSGFAIGVVALFWLNINWLIMLLGCNLSYYLHQPGHLYRSSPARVPRIMEKISLAVMYVVAQRFREGRRPWNLTELINHLSVPGDFVRIAVRRLIDRRLLVVVEGKDETLVPGRALSCITPADVLDAIRNDYRGTMQRMTGVPQPVHRMCDNLESAITQVMALQTFEEMLREKPRSTDRDLWHRDSPPPD